MVAVATTKGERKAELTQKAVAAKLGVSRFYLNRVVRCHLASKRLTERIREIAPHLLETKTNKPKE